MTKFVKLFESVWIKIVTEFLNSISYVIANASDSINGHFRASSKSCHFTTLCRSSIWSFIKNIKKWHFLQIIKIGPLKKLWFYDTLPFMSSSAFLKVSKSAKNADFAWTPSWPSPQRVFCQHGSTAAPPLSSIRSLTHAFESLALLAGRSKSYSVRLSLPTMLATHGDFWWCLYSRELSVVKGLVYSKVKTWLVFDGDSVPSWLLYWYFDGSCLNPTSFIHFRFHRSRAWHCIRYWTEMLQVS